MHRPAPTLNLSGNMRDCHKRHNESSVHARSIAGAPWLSPFFPTLNLGPREATLYCAPSFWPNRKDLPLPQTPLDHKTPQADDEPPPFLGTWRRIYAFVLIHLALWIVVFYFLTERFHSPL